MKKLFSLFAIMLLFANANAQVAPYTFSQLGGTYTEIVGDTTVAFATTTTTSGPLSMDDSVYSKNSLPFPFTFSGSIYTNVVISDNGFITFGAVLPGITNYVPISNTGLYSGAIGGYSRDLIGNRGITATRTLGSNVLTAVPTSQFVGLQVGRIITGTGIPAATTVTALNSGAGTVTISANATAAGTSALLVCSGSIVRGTTGSVGSRVHTIQFKNIRPFTSAANDNCINFQIKLYETSNLVEIVYGTNANSVATTGQVGLRGSVNTDFNNRNTATAGWATTIAGTLNTNTLAMSSTITPATGTTFRWTAPAPPVGNDVGVTAAVFGTSPIQIISVGKGYNIVATVKNIGTNTQNVIPVFYKVNGGSAVGPVNTVGPIITGATENVTFSGGFAFNPITAGVNTVKLYTSLAGDGNAVNDTLTVVLTVQQKIASYPYIQNFTNPVDWTIVTEANIGTTALWGLGICTNANGVALDTAATSNCFNGSAGRIEILRSPEMNIASLTNPVLHFYSSYRTYTGGESDSMQVVISTNGGVNFFNATTVYDKGDLSIPSLATRPGVVTSFFPDSSIQWRHETVSLQNVAGSSNLVIGFRSISDFGNRQWVDNVIVSSNNTACTDNVTAAGVYNCNSLVSLNFATIGLSPFVNNIFETSAKNEDLKSDDSRLVGSFETTEGKVIVESTVETDNPTGGVAYVQQFNVNGNNSGINVNASATNQNGNTYTPNTVATDKYFRTTYTGNDKSGYASYSVSINVASYSGIFNANDAYIMKRVDQTGNWTALTTTASGSVLTATGLNTFSDFSVGYNSVTLTLTARLQAIQLTRKDTLKVNIRNSASPYAIVETKSAVYDSLTGTAVFSLSNVSNGSSYWIELMHRNSIATWSAAPVLVSANLMSFNFTSSLSQAFASNQINVSGVPSIYTGDVSQDGVVDITDILQIYNDGSAFVGGPYVITDLNFDQIVDITDILAAYNNASSFISVQSPPVLLASQYGKTNEERKIILIEQMKEFSKNVLNK